MYIILHHSQHTILNEWQLYNLWSFLKNKTFWKDFNFEQYVRWNFNFAKESKRGKVKIL